MPCDMQYYQWLGYVCRVTCSIINGLDMCAVLHAVLSMGWTCVPCYMQYYQWVIHVCRVTCTRLRRVCHVKCTLGVKSDEYYVVYLGI